MILMIEKALKNTNDVWHLRIKTYNMKTMNSMNTSRRWILEPSTSLHYLSPLPSSASITTLYMDNKKTPSSPAPSTMCLKSPSPHNPSGTEPLP